MRIVFNPSSGGGGGVNYPAPPPGWNVFITFECLNIFARNLVPVYKMYPGTFAQNFKVTWPSCADVSTFCDMWLTKKMTIFRSFVSLITSVILIEIHWNFVQLFIISWITLSVKTVTSFCHACILRTRNEIFRFFGGFWAITFSQKWIF